MKKKSILDDEEWNRHYSPSLVQSILETENDRILQEIYKTYEEMNEKILEIYKSQ